MLNMNQAKKQKWLHAQFWLILQEIATRLGRRTLLGTNSHHAALLKGNHINLTFQTNGLKLRLETTWNEINLI